MMDSFINSEIMAGTVFEDAVPISSIEDPESFRQMIEISPVLPFNLFNLDPLKWIKVTELPSRFATQL